MSKLKPCPFCGGEAKITDGGFSGEQFLVRCSELLCPAASGTVRKTQKQAISTWNRRAQPDNKPLIKETCVFCGQSIPGKNPTNADRIRTMTDEEMAEFIIWKAQTFGNSDYCIIECDNGDCKECALDWLQQPAKEVHNMSEDKTLYWMYADIDEAIDMDYRCEEAKEEHNEGD